MTKNEIKIMELLGCEFASESWYDEEGIEGTRIYLPNGEEIEVFGWFGDIDTKEVIEKMEELNK